MMNNHSDIDAERGLGLKKGWRKIAAASRDSRPPERIHAHYVLEKELARRLLQADENERLKVYGEVYGTLFSRLEDHPQHTRKSHTAQLEAQIRVLKRLVPKDGVYLEIGAGDCRVTKAMARHCREAIGLDVSADVLSADAAPPNFRLELIDGTNFPIASDSVDFAYSNQLVEHLHPGDVGKHFAEVARVLRPGGRYFVITPHSLSGPHDVSKYFDHRPTGFHLIEYTYGTLGKLFADAGLRADVIRLGAGGHYVYAPAALGAGIEAVLGLCPEAWRDSLLRPKIVQAGLGVAMIGRKPG
jgi:SAM-dependent methyltransferase